MAYFKHGLSQNSQFYFISTVRTLLFFILASAGEIVFKISVPLPSKNSIQNYEHFLVLMASSVAENRQIRNSTKEILSSEFRSKNKTGQQKFIFNS